MCRTTWGSAALDFASSWRPEPFAPSNSWPSSSCSRAPRPMLSRLPALNRAPGLPLRALRPAVRPRHRRPRPHLGAAEAPSVAVDLPISNSASATRSPWMQVGRENSETHSTVSGDGKIVLPLVGEISALGLTSAQLATTIQGALKKGGFYADPVIHVAVVGVASSYVTVLGDVGTPGMMPLERNFHLSDMIARVGARPGEGALGAGHRADPRQRGIQALHPRGHRHRRQRRRRSAARGRRQDLCAVRRGEELIFTCNGQDALAGDASRSPRA